METIVTCTGRQLDPVGQNADNNVVNQGSWDFKAHCARRNDVGWVCGDGSRSVKRRRARNPGI